MATEVISLNISGMTCVNCSNGIERAVQKMPGVESSKVSFTISKAEFAIDNELLDKQALIHKIQKLGYGAEEDLAVLEQIKLKDYKRLKSDFLISAALTLMLFYFAFFPVEVDVNVLKL